MINPWTNFGMVTFADLIITVGGWKDQYMVTCDSYNTKTDDWCSLGRINLER